jgi:hypothetical protein
MPDTPIIQYVNGPAYIANTTVNIPQALTNSDQSFTQANLTSEHVGGVAYSDGGAQDQPVTTHAG